MYVNIICVCVVCSRLITDLTQFQFHVKQMLQIPVWSEIKISVGFSVNPFVFPTPDFI
jgi:hypothetical protein